MGDALGGHLGHVLIVDDNEANREVLSRRLERHGYSFAAAEDGIQAMEMMRSQPFDIIMLDIMMPRMNGYQVLEAMKADPALADLPVIVVSAVSELESIVRCVELGAEDYLFKPFNPVLLKARLTAILEKNRRLAALKDSTKRAKVAVQSSLNTIKDAAAALLTHTSDPLTADQRELIQHIEQTAQNLSAQLPTMIP
ncbi:MAG: response regulator [Anaerolineae bacterium]|nr:response regulator [Anaerolineae bacterium]